MVHNVSGQGGESGRPIESPIESPASVASMVENVIGCKWSVSLLRMCAEGQCRPHAFLRGCDGLSAKVMNERLRKMTRFGILQRTVFGEKPPVEVEYRLTAFGSRFMGIIDEVRQLQEAVDQGAMADPGAAHDDARPSAGATRRRG